MGIGCMIPISERHTFGATPRFRDMVELCQTAEAVGVDTILGARPLGRAMGKRQLGTARRVGGVDDARGARRRGPATINLGVLVTCVGWRNPSIVAKMAESVDEISDSKLHPRSRRGLASPEYDMYGLPWDHRVASSGAAINIIRAAPARRQS